MSKTEKDTSNQSLEDIFETIKELKNEITKSIENIDQNLEKINYRIDDHENKIKASMVIQDIIKQSVDENAIKTSKISTIYNQSTLSEEENKKLFNS